jgi:hypothetical protein
VVEEADPDARELETLADLWGSITSERVAEWERDVSIFSTIRAVYTVGVNGYTKSDFPTWDSEKPRKLVRYVVQRSVVWSIAWEKREEFLGYLHDGPKPTHPFRGMSVRQNETRIRAERGEIVRPEIEVGTPKGWVASRIDHANAVWRRVTDIDVSNPRGRWLVARTASFVVADLEALAKCEEYLSKF